MRPAPFALERFFARHEFTARVAELVCTDVGLRAPGEQNSCFYVIIPYV